MGSTQGFSVRRSLALSGLALVTALIGSALAIVPAQANAPSLVRSADAGSGTATISGTLVVAGPGKAPSGVRVTLTGTPTNGDQITRTATSREGAFTFQDLAGGDWSYTVTAPYQGATFSSDLISVPTGQAVTLKLPVFASSESAAKVRTASWIVWLDVTGDRLAVQQDLALTNSGTTAYTGKTPVTGAGEGARAAVVLPIATGASNFQYLGRFEVCCSATEAETWVHTRPVNPGGSSGTLRYEAPRASSLTFKAQFTTDKMTLLVPVGTAVSSPQLKSDGTSTDKNVTYNVYTSGELKAGDTVTVSLVAPTPESSTPWGTIALLVVGLLAVVVAVSLILWRRRHAAAVAPAAPKGPKVAKGNGSTASPPKANATSTQKERQPAKPVKQAGPVTPASTALRTQPEILAEQLAQLDLKFENGELSDEAAYRRVRESLVQQLVDAVATDPTSLS
jgi:hypothetical protein